MQIRAKLTLIYIVSTALLMLVAFLLIFHFSKKEQQESFREQLSKKAETSATLLLSVNEVDSTLLKLIDQNKSDLYSFENISIFSEDGKELYTNNDTIHFVQTIPQFNSVLRSLFHKSKIEFSQNNMEIVGGIHVFKGVKYGFVASAYDTEGKSFLDRLKQTLTYVFISILCITGFIGWIYAGRTLSPINKVMNDLDKITATNLNERLKTAKNKDEITRLVFTFNGFLDRLQQAFNDQKSFISHASHELNNPLASINTQIDVALLNDRSSQEYKDVLQRIKLDLMRLQEVTTQLLLLSKITSESENLSKKVIRIDEIIYQVKDTILKKFPNGKVYLSFSLPENDKQLELYANEALLFTLLNNLIENGLKYSPNQTVNVLLHADEKIKLEISNSISEFSSDELSQIFNPFYRKTSSSSTNGFGMGLAIVKRICDVNKYTIDVKIDESIIHFNLIFI